MLQRGVDPRILDAFGRSALQIAAEEGCVASIEALCADKNADVNHRTNYNSSRSDFGGDDETWSALDLAARGGHVNAMEALVAHGCNIDAESDSDFSALHMAADGNKPDAIDFLVQAGLNVEGSNEGWRPLDFAVETDSTEAIRALVRHGANLYAANNESLYPPQYAVTTKHEAALTALLDAGAHPFYAPLHKAIEQWSSCGESMAKTLLKRGANIDPVDDNGDTPLHRAAQRTYDVGAAAIKFLVKAGADVNHREGGWTLHVACKYRNPNSVVTLLELGADLTLRDLAGNTPRHNAARVRSAALVDILLRAAGNDTALETAVNRIGETPATYSQSNLAEQPRRDDCEALLTGAPADRAWRRRGALLLCRAFPGKARLAAEKDRPSAKMPRTIFVKDWVRFDRESGDSFLSLLQRCFELAEEGIFRSIVGFL